MSTDAPRADESAKLELQAGQAVGGDDSNGGEGPGGTTSRDNATERAQTSGESSSAPTPDTGLPRSSSTTVLPNMSLQECMQVDRLDVVKFLRSHSCYDFMPESGKVVVLDIRISVKLAFFALVEHELTYAPLWDEAEHNHVGMLTSTDLIQILEHGYHHNCVTRMFTMTVGAWLRLKASFSSSPRSRAGTDNTDDSSVAPDHDVDQAAEHDLERQSFSDAAPARLPRMSGCPKVHAERSLFEAVQVLQAHRKQRLAIVDRDDRSTLLQVLTNHRLLLHIVKHFTRHTRCDLVAPRVFLICSVWWLHVRVITSP